MPSLYFSEKYPVIYGTKNPAQKPSIFDVALGLVITFFIVMTHTLEANANNYKALNHLETVKDLENIKNLENIENQEITTGEFQLTPLNAGNEISAKNIINTRFATLEKTDITVDATGMIARVIVKQHFKNESEFWSEGKYIFPLPNDAAVDYMAMHIGERKIVGTVKEKNEAKKIYEKAKNAGKKASLVSQHRPNLFSNKVANIAPGESITVELHYVETIHYEHGQFSLRLPTTITPRYFPLSFQSDSQTRFSEANHQKDSNKNTSHAFSHIENFEKISTSQSNIFPSSEEVETLSPPMKPSNAASPISVTATINAGLPLQKIISKYHPFQQHNLENNYTLSIAESAIANKDVVIEWTPKLGTAPIAASFNQRIDNQDYLLLMVMPPQNISSQNTLPKETVFVIDTSGSMAGKSIQQAKLALANSLGHLTPKDRFNIIEFNSNHRALFPKSVIASPQNIKLARYFISSLEANGGTEMAGALNAAFSNQEDYQFVRQVIFMTDGSVGNEDALFNLIEQKRLQSRLFTVGIGSAPNSYFMEQAAESGQGTFTFINSSADITQGIGDLFFQISNPIMTDISIQFPHKEVEFYPKKYRDLYAGEPLLISAKTDKPFDKNIPITINGKIFTSNNTSGHYISNSATSSLTHQTPQQVSTHQDSTERFEQLISLDGQQKASTVSKLWARHKLKDLSNQERKLKRNYRGMVSAIQPSGLESIKASIINVALEHQLLSQYTSFVAVEERITRPKDSPLVKQKIPNALPEGSNQLIQQHSQPTFTIAMPSSGLGIMSLWIYTISGLLCMGLLGIYYRKENLQM